jgi:hypothetical protein
VSQWRLGRALQSLLHVNAEEKVELAGLYGVRKRTQLVGVVLIAPGRHEKRVAPLPQALLGGGQVRVAVGSVRVRDDVHVPQALVRHERPQIVRLVGAVSSVRERLRDQFELIPFAHLDLHDMIQGSHVRKSYIPRVVISHKPPCTVRRVD